MAKVDYHIKKRANNAYVVCQECGIAHGRGVWVDGVLQAQRSQSTWTKRKCEVCYKKRMCTEFRDFGYSKYTDENLEDEYENDD
jgi:NMD protein affecting ribosome stability and mRNA decay